MCECMQKLLETMIEGKGKNGKPKKKRRKRKKKERKKENRKQQEASGNNRKEIGNERKREERSFAQATSVQTARCMSALPNVISLCVALLQPSGAGSWSARGGVSRTICPRHYGSGF